MIRPSGFFLFDIVIPPPSPISLATRPDMAVAKSIELLAEGESLEDATEEAVRQASKTVENIQNVYVDEYQGIVEDGRISTYRVHTKVTFLINE